MGPEKMQVLGESQKGIGVLVSSGPWRMLLISRWDEELFKDHGSGEIHAVFLPASTQGIPKAFWEWLERINPLLVVFSDAPPELTNYLQFHKRPFLDLKHVGALSFKTSGPRLELRSFLKGPLGFYSFPEGVFI
jgi:hypothetical protein